MTINVKTDKTCTVYPISNHDIIKQLLIYETHNCACWIAGSRKKPGM